MTLPVTPNTTSGKAEAEREPETKTLGYFMETKSENTWELMTWDLFSSD